MFLSFIFSSDVLIERAEVVGLNAYQEKSDTYQDIQIHSTIRYPNIDNPSIYIFNIENGGYILISSEDRTKPVLAFAFKNHFEIENLPPQLEDLLSYYIDQIEYIRISDIQPSDEIISKWNHYTSNPFNPIRDSRNVEPMLETNWGQSEGYNQMCPANGGQNTKAGCVAVAMSQIMKYWEHPASGTGYYSYTQPEFGLIEADFNTSYDWDQMENDYPTYASSLLLFHAGVAVEMEYGFESSGAHTGVDCEIRSDGNTCISHIEEAPIVFNGCQVVIDYYEWDEDACARDAQCGFCEESYLDYSDYPFPNALDGLKQFFAYNPNATFISKEYWSENEYYSDTDWIDMLKNQLDQGYPLMHKGKRLIEGEDYVGHTWNIDGYQGDEFHCNWGWYGQDNGYYTITDLAPVSTPYSYTRGAIFDLYPSYSWIPGDINGDGVLNVMDIVVTANMALADEYDEIADMNEDGNLNVVDIILLVNCIMSDCWESETSICDGLTEVELWGEYYDIATTISINLTAQELTGSIPPEIGCLTNLTYLNLESNQLTGEIPSEIGNLTSLSNLILHGNQLSGEIPPEIGNLTNLNHLYLSFNELSGSIPSSIGNLTNLNWLNLFFNQLTGEIPSEIGNLTNLTHLWLYNNQLTGEIPHEIGNLTNLTNLKLYSNQLTGDIPRAVCDLIESNNLNIDDILYDNNLTNNCP